MQVDDPPYLPIGTAVSAKYKGAFCEAKVRSVDRNVKCKVTFKMGLGTTTITDQQIAKGTIRVGQIVQVKLQEKKDLLDATITKIQDCSQYTVVFDDGDITKLRRTALCLKSGRHFNESETLDQLPLTHPEHFGNPVMGGGNHRRGRRGIGSGSTIMSSTSASKQISNDSSDEADENDDETEPDFEGYTIDIGRVVNVESTEKKRGKENWFPGLIVIPTAQPTSKINFKEEYLIRSFKDDRYYTVPKKEISEFNKNIIEKIDNNNSGLLEAVNKAIKYLETNELPEHWEKRLLFNIHAINIESDDNLSESSDDEPCEEKDRFVAQLYKFMDDSGTPLNKSPMICNKDVDLHRLFRVVHKFGGYNRVTNQNKWRSITNRLKLTTSTTTATTSSQNIYNQVKQVYKKCLLSYESFYRTLGVTMLNHTRSTKKNRGRSLIRDKDRSTPVMSSSPKLENNIKDEDDNDNKKDNIIEKLVDVDKLKKKSECMEKSRRKEIIISDNNSDSNSNISEEPTESKIKRTEKMKEIKKIKMIESPQQTRSKIKNKEMKKLPDPSKTPKKMDDEQTKKRGRKKTGPNIEDNEVNESITVNIGDKLKVYYGPNQDSKITYEAKIIEIDKDSTGPIYLVHYTGWNTRYDEWITLNRIAENLSATTKAKRLNKQQQQQQQEHSQSKTKSSNNNNNNNNRRGRGTSVTGRSTEQPTRSTTPSSVTSTTSSRTKSPAITVRTTRSSKLEFSRKLRRHSAQTDFSNHSDSDSDDDDFSDDNDVIRTRSSSKNDEPTTAATAAAIRTYKKRILKNKEEEKRANRNKRKKSPEKQNNSDDDNSDHQLPKGRDFDLNQIRSELKGFSKTIKLPLDNDDDDDDDDDDDKESSSDSTTLKNEIVEQKKVDNSTSDDIYEFKEPEPFEFEARGKLSDDSKPKKRLAQRLFDDLDKPTTTTKKIKSPPKEDVDKKRFRKLSNKSDDNDNKDEFDKLVESPSFNNISKLDKSQDKKLIKNLLDEPLFKELPESIDDYNKDSLSDDNSPLFVKGETIFNDFNKLKTDELIKQKDSDDDCDLIRDTIQRVIAHGSSTDDDDFNDNDDSNDNLLITPSTSSYAKKRNDSITDKKIESSNIIPLSALSDSDKIFSTISPALQETDTTLLESIYSQPNILKTNETTNLIKTGGTKIADSILEKFNSIKNKDDGKIKEKVDNNLKQKSEKKRRNKIISRQYIDDDDDNNNDTDSDSDSEQLIIARSDEDSQTNSIITDKCNDNDDLKSDSNLSMTHIGVTDESQNDNDDKRNFKFDNNDNKNNDIDDNKKEDEEHDLHSLLLCEETLPPKSPQPDNDKLIINKTITQPNNDKNNEMPFASAPSSSSAGNNGNKNLLSGTGNNDNKVKQPIINNNNNNVVAALILPPTIDNKNLHPVIDNTPPTTPESTISNLSPAHNNDDNIDDLSPPTNNENDSGKSDDVDFTSTVSATGIANRKRKSLTNITKLPSYSEEDTQMTSDQNASSPVKKQRDDASCSLAAAPCKKRRKSNRTNNDDNLQPVVKRGRKPLNRSRHNSDSDDTSEHSLIATTTLNLNAYDRTNRSPRPSKYNFFVDLDPALTSNERISILLEKLSDIRKAYSDVKTELATVERRRKKIRRRQREQLKASKQELG